MDRLFDIKPGMDAVAVWRTKAHPQEGVIATEGDVEMILQEELAGMPAGTELGGKGVFGKLPEGTAAHPSLWRSTEPPEKAQRFFVRILAARVPGSGMVWPVCMMVTMDGVWGTSLTKHESGALVVKEMARVKAVAVFDERMPTSK